MVRAQQTRLAVAAERGSLRDLGVGDHAATDTRGGCGGALPGVYGAVSDAGGAGAGAGAGCAGDVERAGLLPAGAHAAQGGAVCERESGRQFAGEGGGAARSAGDWRVHGRGDSEHRARRAGGRGGWKCGAGTLPLRGLGSGKGRPHGAAAQGGGPGAQAAGSARGQAIQTRR